MRTLALILSISIVINIVFVGIAIAIYSTPICWEYLEGEDGNYIFICEGGRK